MAAGGVLVALLAGWAALADQPAEEQTAEPATASETEPMAIGGEHSAEMAESLELFRTRVRQVLVDNCVDCHSGPEAEVELDLSTRDGLLVGSWNGEVFTPGTPAAESPLMLVLRHELDPYMPMDASKLAEEDLAAIERWLDLGAAYDAPLVEEHEVATPWTEEQVDPEDREWWAFQPFSEAPAPQVADANGWCRNPIDQFILAKLHEVGLEPNPEADKRTLIRRAYFDLTGLPPSAEDVEAFLADDKPGAYERVIDQLLASPAYGERWGRHWLDLARFAESHGYEHDYDRPTAYHYRDFVIEALNQDMPYDQFISWQLAGDELAPNDPLAMMATGFLAAGVHNTQITANEVEKERYNDLDDMASTVGTSMLGLTIGCARCHDHKFDPIPQADYYRFISIFTTAVRGEVNLTLDDGHYRHARELYEQQHTQLEGQLAHFELEELPRRMAEWEATPEHTIETPWQLMRPSDYGAENGTTLTLLDDASLVASGPNPLLQNYHFICQTSLERVTAVRIEALTHESLVHGGPGRAFNGNFALSSVKVVARPLVGEDQPVELRLINPRATFEQAGLPVAAAIDADDTTAWAVDPEFGRDHAAVFDVAEPFTFEGGTVLTITLGFSHNGEHGLGRLRLSATGEEPTPPPRVAGIAPEIKVLLDVPAEARTADQQVSLLNWYKTIDPEWRRLNEAVQELERNAPAPPVTRALVTSEGIEPIRLHTQGADYYEETYFLKRGDPNQKAGVARAGFLQAITPLAEDSRWEMTPSEGDAKSYRRSALAHWMTDEQEGAGDLAARVMANRLWHYHFGRGIVATPSDFGHQGAPPTHPELLDWLARELVQNGWELKAIHRLIMTSAAYRQSSALDAEKFALDDANTLVWRWNVRRLEAESIRDSMLAVSGQLERRMYGPGTLNEGMTRRSIYFTVKRSYLIPILQLFDWPEALGSQGNRPSTTVAPQALTFMNNGYVRDYARHFAQRAAPTVDVSAEDAVRSAWRIALGRAPSETEETAAEAFLARQQVSYERAGRENARQMALTDLCQALFSLNEFVYID